MQQSDDIFKKDDQLIANSENVSMEAIAKIQSALKDKMDPEIYNSAFNQACMLIPKAQYAEAIALFETVRETAASNAEKGNCENSIGACYFFLGDFEKALDYYTQSFHNGFDTSIIEDNIWEVCEELIKSAGDQAKWSGHYAELFPNGKYSDAPVTEQEEIPNVMKNIQLIELDKYKDNPRYQLISGTIFKDLEEDHCVFAVSYELEGSGDSQYPLEDVLDEFYLHVSDFINEESLYTSKIKTIELGGAIENIQTAIATIIGKSIYNAEYSGDEGKTYIKLVIE
jgi:tetratricopeptide (TPR) repeat protein